MAHRTTDPGSALPENVNVRLTEREAAVHVGYSAQHLKRLRAEGRGPRFTQPIPGGKVRYSRADLDAWLATKGQRSG